jgi:microcompartment protein CcmL/EutN
MGKSIGIIETLGYTAALTAADMMVKMAYVEVVSIERTGSGLVTIIIEGDIDSVKMALEVGTETAQKCGELVGVHSIAKPLVDLNKGILSRGQ